VLMTIVFVEAFRRWYGLLQIHKTMTDSYGDQVLATAEDS